MPNRSVPIRFESLARETLDEPDGREHLVQPLDELRLELLDAFGSRHQRAHVIAEAEVEKRHHRERQQRNRQVQRRQNREHHHERDHRGGKREQPAHHEVLDRVRVDVDAVHRVAGVRGDVMVQAERLNLLEEPAPQLVHHALPGIDLQLRCVGGHELIDRLEHHASDDDEHQQRDQVASRHRRQPRPERFRNRLPLAAQDVIDHDLERPWLQRAEPDFQQQQHREQRHLPAMGAQECERPAKERVADRSIARSLRRRARRLQESGRRRGRPAPADAEGHEPIATRVGDPQQFAFRLRMRRVLARRMSRALPRRRRE